MIFFAKLTHKFVNHLPLEIIVCNINVLKVSYIRTMRHARTHNLHCTKLHFSTKLKSIRLASKLSLRNK